MATDLDQIVVEINEIIGWYKSLPQDYTGINELMYQRVQLSTLMSYYATELGDIRTEWRNAEAETERVRREYTKHYIDAGQPISKASEYGRFYSIEQYAKEKQYDGFYNKMKFFYDATYAVLDTINQHISNLKREEQMAKMTQT